MTADPYFTDVGKAQGAPSRRGRWVRRVVLYPALALSGCHTLLTGSPVPLWHVERLDRPVAVEAVTEDALVLADGRRVRLPCIKRLPVGDPVFRLALRHGVEVSDRGEVFGLIDPPRTCGNDSVAFSRVRADLRELAGLLDPGGIDDSIVHPEAVQEIKNHGSRSLARNGMPYFIVGQLRRVRRAFECRANEPQDEAVVTRSYRLD
jgi:hypothetical protein